MRALPRQLHRLPLPRLLGCLRLAAEITLVAVLLGRSAPEPVAEPAPRPRQPAHPRYLGTDGNYFGNFPGNPPVLLDTETGALVPCPVAGMRQVGPLGCSPWRDGAGQYHLAGIARESASGSYVLMRCAFPAGPVHWTSTDPGPRPHSLPAARPPSAGGAVAPPRSGRPPEPGGNRRRRAGIRPPRTRRDRSRPGTSRAAWRGPPLSSPGRGPVRRGTSSAPAQGCHWQHHT